MFALTELVISGTQCNINDKLETACDLYMFLLFVIMLIIVMLTESEVYLMLQ